MDIELDMMSWPKTRQEFEDGTMIGRFCGLHELPKGVPRSLNRFAIHERYGGAESDSLQHR